MTEIGVYPQKAEVGNDRQKAFSLSLLSPVIPWLLSGKGGWLMCQSRSMYGISVSGLVGRQIRLETEGIFYDA